MKAWKSFVALFDEEDPDEPRYDPVHLAGVLVGTTVAAGASFWLLWTVLVYEGGPASRDGRLPRLIALVLVAGVVAVLQRADRKP